MVRHSSKAPVPTQWRCLCGNVETPTTRCGLLQPWETEEARLWEECAQWRDEETTKTRRLIPEHVHGTASGYQYWRCRCAPCREWNATTQRVLRTR